MCWKTAAGAGCAGGGGGHGWRLGRSQGGAGRGLAPPLNVKFPLIFFEI
jgi:hypothetical protein